jgi:hypothetical protein
MLFQKAARPGVFDLFNAIGHQDCNFFALEGRILVGLHINSSFSGKIFGSTTGICVFCRRQSRLARPKSAFANRVHDSVLAIRIPAKHVVFTGSGIRIAENMKIPGSEFQRPGAQTRECLLPAQSVLQRLEDIAMFRIPASRFASQSDPDTGGGRPATAPPHLRPGDEAPPGTPGTGENLCGHCGGTGQLQGQPCPACEGTGQVITGIGGA